MKIRIDRKEVVLTKIHYIIANNHNLNARYSTIRRLGKRVLHRQQ